MMTTLNGQVENSEITETWENDFLMFPFSVFICGIGYMGIFENSEDESSENIFRGFRDFREIRVFELPLLTELSKE